MRKIFVRLIYPTYRGDWYKRKGYSGTSYQERFDDFVSKQKLPGSIYYDEFKSLKLTRKFIGSSGHKIDLVEIKPSKLLSQNKPGEGLYIVCFLGKSEYYESRFRDMALFAKNTGATIIGFNPKGFHASSGKTKVLMDIVDDGIALIEYLLSRSIKHEKIVLYGNSLGALVQELVCRHFRNVWLINFRQINSNSFSSLAVVIASNMRISYFESLVRKLMKYCGWEVDYEKDFYKTGVYRCVLSRKGDKVIKKQYSFYAKINNLQDAIDAPNGYKETLKWLNENNELIPITLSKKDPHALSLHHLYLSIQDTNGCNFTVWYFVNRYLENSNKFI